MSEFTIEDAIVIATNAHKGQFDKAGFPYIYHPLRVMNAVFGDNMKMAAVLHDVIEDTEISYSDLRLAGVPPKVMGALEVLTKRKSENHADYLTRIVESNNPIAIVVKWADVMDNSSHERISHLSKEDQERVTAKYLKARRMLMSAM